MAEQMGEVLRHVMALKPQPVEPPVGNNCRSPITSRMAAGKDNVARLGNSSIYRCPIVAGVYGNSMTKD